MYNFIMLICVLTGILTTYYTMKSATKPRRNIVIGVTLPKEVLDDSRVLGIISEYKSMINKVLIANLLTSIPIFIIDRYSLNIIYMIVWMIIVCSWSINYPFKTMNRKLKKIKEENDWYIGEKRIVSIDTKLSRLKNKMPIADKYMMIPILISIMTISISISSKDQDLKYMVFIAIINTLIVISIYIFGFRSIKKSKLKVYSKNSKINYAINKEEKYLNSIMWFLVALIESIVYLVAYFYIFDVINVGSGVIAFITLGSSIGLSIGFIYTSKKVRELEEDLAKEDGQTIYTDDDEFWIDGYKYYNENDRSTTVNSRYGFGYTYNLANKKGKFATYGIGIIVAIFMTPIFINNILMDFSNHKINIDKENRIISVDYPSYDYSFNIDDIEGVELVGKVSFKMRVNGIGTEEYSRGSFKAEEYGRCKVYIYNESRPYIVVKLNDNYFIYNEKTKKETIRIYHEILSVI